MKWVARIFLFISFAFCYQMALTLWQMNHRIPSVADSTIQWCWSMWLATIFWINLNALALFTPTQEHNVQQTHRS